MGDAAQGEPIQHEVFTTPFKVEPVYEMWDTPPNYRRYPGGNELPDKLKVWRIQNSGKTFGGVVSRSSGFDDSPDAEMLTPGFNVGKESGAMGVGRHGNFLQWGYSASPAQMTEAGRRFFVNCICYIRKFDGIAPLIRRSNSPRMDAVRMAMLLNNISDPKRLESFFSADLAQRYKGNPEGLAAYYRENIELVYRETNGFLIDTELKSLGIESNRAVAGLERLIGLLTDPAKAPLATKLLKRYTRESFQRPEQWQAWFEKNRARMFFTDVGGYRFMVVPEGYPVRERK